MADIFLSYTRADSQTAAAIAEGKPNGDGVAWNVDGTVRRQGIWTNDRLTTPLTP